MSPGCVTDAERYHVVRVQRRLRQTFLTHFEISRRRLDGVVIYFFDSDYIFSTTRRLLLYKVTVSVNSVKHRLHNKKLIRR